MKKNIYYLYFLVFFVGVYLLSRVFSLLLVVFILLVDWRDLQLVLKATYTAIMESLLRKILNEHQKTELQQQVNIIIQITNNNFYFNKFSTKPNTFI